MLFTVLFYRQDASGYVFRLASPGRASSSSSRRVPFRLFSSPFSAPSATPTPAYWEKITSLSPLTVVDVTNDDANDDDDVVVVGSTSDVKDNVKYDVVDDVTEAGAPPPVMSVSLSSLMYQPGVNTLTIFSTYPSDFNAIEYTQRLSCYIEDLRSQTLGINNFNIIMNGDPSSIKTHARLLQAPQDSNVTFLSDPKGLAGRAFGCSRGYRPEDSNMSPYLKLYMMLFGFGCWATLPAVAGGYIGNPFRGQRWVEHAMARQCKKGVWPANGLVLDADGNVEVNKVRGCLLVCPCGPENCPFLTTTLKHTNAQHHNNSQTLTKHIQRLHLATFSTPSSPWWVLGPVGPSSSPPSGSRTCSGSPSSTGRTSPLAETTSTC